MGRPPSTQTPDRGERAAGSLVRVEEHDGITTVVLDDPGRRNALSWDLVSALIEAVDRGRRRGREPRAGAAQHATGVQRRRIGGRPARAQGAPGGDLPRLCVLGRGAGADVAAVDGAAVGRASTSCWPATSPSHPRLAFRRSVPRRRHPSGGARCGASPGPSDGRGRRPWRSSARCSTARRPPGTGWSGAAWRPTNWPARPSAWPGWRRPTTPSWWRRRRRRWPTRRPPWTTPARRWTWRPGARWSMDRPVFQESLRELRTRLGRPQ